MIRYTLLIEEDRKREKNPGRSYGAPEYETENVTLIKVEGETAARGTALDAIIAAAKDLMPVKASIGVPPVFATTGPVTYQTRPTA